MRGSVFTRLKEFVKCLLVAYRFSLYWDSCSRPPRPGQADDKPPRRRFRFGLNSIDRTLDDFKYFLSLAGQKDAADQLDGLKKNVLPNGFEGIDTKKPWGLYGMLKSDPPESAAVADDSCHQRKSVFGLA